MLAYLARMARRRKQISLGGLLVVIAAAALLVNWFRPVSQVEAEQIASRRFQRIPGAAAWSGRYRIRSYFAEPNWYCNITDSATGRSLAQVSLSRRGDPLAAIVSLPGHAAPLPAEALTTAIPPPDEWRERPNGPRSTMAAPTPMPAP